MPQVLGRATIRVDGRVIESHKGAVLKLGGVKRNEVIYGRKVGFAEETVSASVECETALEKGLSLEYLRSVTGATVTYEADTGHVWVIRDAFVGDALEMKDGEGGNIKLVFIGPSAEEASL
jgi:hypothetical protein